VLAGCKQYFSDSVRYRHMSSKEILEQAMSLNPVERFMIVEGLLNSIDEPDRRNDEIWAEEAEKRLKAYRAGRLDGVPMEDVFGNKR
jgi:putative addiction module component (TIGR02574 family)